MKLYTTHTCLIIDVWGWSHYDVHKNVVGEQSKPICSCLNCAQFSSDWHYIYRNVLQRVIVNSRSKHQCTNYMPKWHYVVLPLVLQMFSSHNTHTDYMMCTQVGPHKLLVAGPLTLLLFSRTNPSPLHLANPPLLPPHTPLRPPPELPRSHPSGT